MLTLGVLVVVMALIGCGGGSATGEGMTAFDVEADTTMTPAAKLTKADVIAHMEKVCPKAWRRIRSNFALYLRTQHRKRSHRERTASAIRVSLMADIDFHIFDDLHAFGAPPGEKIRLERIIGAMQEAVERGQRLGPLHSASEVVELFAKFNRRGSRYGLDACLVDRAHLKFLAPMPSGA